MSKKLALAISLTFILLAILDVEFEVQSVEASENFEVGDWIRYEVTITPTIQGEITPIWVNFEFLSVDGTNATVEATMRLSDGTERTETMTIDTVSGSGTGLIIPLNSKTGDSIYISNQGNITIEGETTLICTGVERTAFRASSSNSTHSFACYWDKQTGIMLEEHNTADDTTTVFRVKNTNMWQTSSLEGPPDAAVLYVMIIVVATIVILTFLRTRKKKPRRRTNRKRR